MGNPGAALWESTSRSSSYFDKLGNAHGDLRGYWRKKVLLEGALETQEQHYRKEHPAVAVTLTNLGNAHGKLGGYWRKKDLLHHALEIQEGQHYVKISTPGNHHRCIFVFWINHPVSGVEYLDISGYIWIHFDPYPQVCEHVVKRLFDSGMYR